MASAAIRHSWPTIALSCFNDCTSHPSSYASGTPEINKRTGALSNDFCIHFITQFRFSYRNDMSSNTPSGWINNREGVIELSVEQFVGMLSPQLESSAIAFGWIDWFGHHLPMTTLADVLHDFSNAGKLRHWLLHHGRFHDEQTHRISRGFLVLLPTKS